MDAHRLLPGSLFLRRGRFLVVQQRLEVSLYRRVHLMEQQEPSV